MNSGRTTMPIGFIVPSAASPQRNTPACHLSRRRQKVSRAQAPFEDGASQLAINLTAEVLAAGEADVDFHAAILRDRNWSVQTL